MSNRRVVFVVGSGRSGTSTMAGTLRTLGLHVPQPEVVADATNPKGFGEPRWVVDLHPELLRAATCRSPTPARAPGSTPAPPAATTPPASASPSGSRSQFGDGRRARRQGPARLVVPRPVARRGRALRRHAVLRHDAAPGHRGGRLQADLLRPDGCRLRPGRHHPHRGLGQHDAPHRARHPRPAARLRALRRPARRLDAAGLRPGRGVRPRRREDRDGRRHRRGAPLHRPVAAPRDDDVGRHRRARPGCASSPTRPGRRSTRSPPTTRRSTRSGATSCAPPTPRSTPRPRRSPTRPSSRSGVRPPRRRVARPASRPRGPRPTGCPTPYARWCRRRPARGCARRSAGSARPRIGPDA